MTQQYEQPTGRVSSDRSGDGITLRAFREEDSAFLDRLDTDPDALGPFEWSGFIEMRERRRQWEKGALAVQLPDGTVAGLVSWKATHRAGPERGVCYEIGAALVPEHRGHGVGSAAQRLVVDHLFRFTTAHRLEALTDEENTAERRALERIGFQQEGVLREVVFFNGSWRNTVIYALLRRDH